MLLRSSILRRTRILQKHEMDSRSRPSADVCCLTEQQSANSSYYVRLKENRWRCLYEEELFQCCLDLILKLIVIYSNVTTHFFSKSLLFSVLTWTPSFAATSLIKREREKEMCIYLYIKVFFSICCSSSATKRSIKVFSSSASNGFLSLIQHNNHLNRVRRGFYKGISKMTVETTLVLQ